MCCAHACRGFSALPPKWAGTSLVQSSTVPTSPATQQEKPVQIRPGAEPMWNAFIWVKLPFLWRYLAAFRSNFRTQTPQFPHKNVFKHCLTAVLPCCRAGKSSQLMRSHYKVDNLPLPFKKPILQSFIPFSPHWLSSKAFPAARKKPEISQLQD